MSSSGGQHVVPVPPWERGLPPSPPRRARRPPRSWIVLASVVAVLAAATGAVWAAGGFHTQIPYEGFEYGETVVAGDAVVTVKAVGFTEGVPGQDADPRHDYINVAATIRWKGNRGQGARNVASVLRAGLIDSPHSIGSPTTVLDADQNNLRTINPGMDYETVACWPIGEEQPAVVVVLSLLATTSRSHKDSHYVAPVTRTGNLVRTDLFKAEDLR